MIKESIKKKILNHKIISFDIYDTLICRNVEKPEDIFSLTEIIYNNTRCKNCIEILKFKEQRIEAYKKAYCKKKSKCTIDDIYREISYPENILTALKKIEIKLEYDLAIVNKEIFEIFEYCKSINKEIVLVSDMYLSECVISKILEKCKIYGYKK